MSNKKKFTIPKRAASKELLEFCEKSSREYSKIKADIEHSFWNTKCGIQINKIEIVNNEELNAEFKKKKLEMQKESKRDSWKSHELIYGFRSADDRSQAKQLCKSGLAADCIGPSMATCLGDPKHGIYLSRCADVLSRGAPRVNRPLVMVVFQILKGRLKSIAEQHGSDNDLMEPTPSFDGHISNNFRNTEPGSVKNPYSYGKIFDSCQIFLYEIDLDSEDLYSKRPRQCLPYAVVYYTFTYTPPIDTPILETQSKVAPPKSNESQASVSKADPQDPFAADSSFASELEKAQVVWTGKLFHKLASLTDVRVISHARDTLIHVPLLSDHISIRMKMKMSKLKESLPKVLFNSTPFDSKDPKVTKNGREYLHCEMYPLNKRSTTYARLKRLLKLRSEVVILKLHQGSDLFILPTCELTKQLGITFDDYPEVLHLIFTYKTGENYALASGSDSFKTDARTILDSRILEVEKLKLTTPTVAPPPLLDIDNDSESPFYDEEDWQDYPLFFTDVEKEAISVRIQRARKAATEEMIMSGHRYKTVYKTPYFITRPGGVQVIVPINQQVDAKIPYQVQQHATSVNQLNATATDPRLNQRPLPSSFSDIQMGEQGSYTDSRSDEIGQGSMSNALIGGPKDPRFQNRLQVQRVSSFSPNVQPEKCQESIQGQTPAPAAGRAKDRTSSLSTMSNEHSSDQVSAQSLAHLVLQNPGPHRTDAKESMAVAEESICSTPPGSSANNNNSVISQAPGIPSVGIAYAQPQGINRKIIDSRATNLPEHPRNVKPCDPQGAVNAGGNFDRGSDARFFEKGRESDRKPQDPRLKAKTLEGPIVPEVLSSHTVELKKLMTKLGVNFVSNPTTESVVENRSANLTAVDSGVEFSPSTNSLTIGNYLNRIRVSSEVKEAIKSNEIENELYAKAEEVVPTFDKPQDPRRNFLLPAVSDSSVSSNANSEAILSSEVAAGHNIDKPTVSKSSDVVVPSPKSDAAPLVSSAMAVDTNTLPKFGLDGLSGYASAVTTSDNQSLNTSAVKDPGASLSSQAPASTSSFNRKDHETSYFGVPSGSESEACQSADVYQHDGKLARATGSRFSTNHFWKQSGSPFRTDQSKTTGSMTASNEPMKNVPCSPASESLKLKDKPSADINIKTDSHMSKDSKALLAPAAVSTNSEHQVDKDSSSKQAVSKSITSAKSDLTLTISGADTAMPPRSTYSSRFDNHGTIPSIAKNPIPPLMGAQCFPVTASYMLPTGRVESGLERCRTLEQQRIAEQEMFAEQQRVLEQQRIVDQQRIAQQRAIAFAQQLAMRQPQAMAIQHVLAQQQIVQQQAMAFRASQAAKSQAYQAYKPLTPPPQPPALAQSLFSMLSKTAIDPMLMPSADQSNLIFLDQTASGRRHSFSRHQDNVNKVSTYKRNDSKSQRKRDQTYGSGTISKGSSPGSIDKREGEARNKSKKTRESKIKSDARDNSFGSKKTESLKSSATGLPDENIDDADEDIYDSPVSLIAEDDWSDRSVDLENNDLDQDINPKDQRESNRSIGNKLCDQSEDERSMDELLARYKELKQQLSIECDVEMSENLGSDVDITTKPASNQDTTTSAICSEHNEHINNDAQIDRSGTSSKEELESEMPCHEHERQTSLLASNEKQPFSEGGNVAHADHVSFANIEGRASRLTEKDKEPHSDTGQGIAEVAAPQLQNKTENLDINTIQTAAGELENYLDVTPVRKEKATSQPLDKNQERDENVSFENVSPVSKEETASEPFDKNQERDENVSFENVSPVSKEESASEPFDKNQERDENVSFENVSPVGKEETPSEPLDKNQERDEHISFENVSPVSKEEAASEPFDKNQERDENVSFENVSPVSKEETASKPFDKNQELDEGISFDNVSPVSKEETASELFDKNQGRDENVSFENVSLVSKEETASEPFDKNQERDGNVSFENVSPVSKEETASEPFDKKQGRDENVSFENVSPVSKEETASKPFDKNQELDEGMSFENVSPVSKEETGSEPVDKNQELVENVSFENVSPVSKRETASEPFDKNQERDENVSFENVSPISKEETASEPFDKNQERDENVSFENVSPVSKEETASEPFDKNQERDENVFFENVSPFSKEETASEPFDKNQERDENVYFENVSPISKAETSLQPFEKSLEANDNVSFENVSPVSNEETASQPFDRNEERSDSVHFEDISPVSKAETSSQPFEKILEQNDNGQFEDISPISKEETASQPFDKNLEQDGNAPFQGMSAVGKEETASQSPESSTSERLNDNTDQEVADLLKNDQSAGDTSPEQADTPVSIFLESEDDDIGLACKEFVKSIMNDEKETESLTKDSRETEESAVTGIVDADTDNGTNEIHSREKPTKRRIFYGGLDIRQTEDIASELVTSPLDGKEELCITIATDKPSDAIDCDSNDPKVSVNKAEGMVDVERSQEEDLRTKLNKLRMEKRKEKRLQSVISEPPEQGEGERADYNPVAEKTEDANENYVEGEKSRKQESHVTAEAVTTKNDCNVDDKKPGGGRKLRSSTRNDVVCGERSENGSPKKSPRKGPEGKSKDVVTRSLRSSAKNRRDSPGERGRYKQQNRNRSSPSSSRSPSGHRRGRSRKSEASRDKAYRRSSRSRIRRSRSRRRSYSRERSCSRGRCPRSRRRLSPSRKRRSRSRGRRSYSTDRRSRRKGSRSPDSFGRDISRRTRAGLKRDKQAIDPSVNANLRDEESSLLSKDAVESTKGAREDDDIKTVCELESPCEKGIHRETDEGKQVGREGEETDKNGDNPTRQDVKETEGHITMKGLVAIPTITNMTVADNNNGVPPHSEDKPKESTSTLNWYDEAEKMKYNVSTETRDSDANGNSKQLIDDKALAVSGLIPVAIGATNATLVEFANSNSQTSMNVNDLNRQKTSGLQPYLPCKDFDDQMFDEVYSIDKTLSNTNLKDKVLTAVNESVQSFDPPPAKKSKLVTDTPCDNTNVTGNEILEEVLQGVAALDKDLVLLEAKEQGKVDVIAVCDMDLSEEDSQPGSTEDSAVRRESFDSEQESQDNEKPDEMSYPDLKADPNYKTSSIMQDLMSWSQNTAKVLSKTLASPREKELPRLPSQRSMMAASVNIDCSKVQSQAVTATITTAVSSHLRDNIGKPSEAISTIENVRSGSNSRMTVPEKQYFIPTIANVAKPLEEARLNEKRPSTPSISHNLVAVEQESAFLEVGDAVGRKVSTKTVGRVRPLVQEAIESGSLSLSFKKDNGNESQDVTKEGRHSEKSNKDMTKAVTEIQEHDFPSRAPNSSGKLNANKGGKETRTEQVNSELKEPSQCKLTLDCESTKVSLSQKPTKIVRPHVSHDERNYSRDPISIHSHVRTKKGHRTVEQMSSHGTKLPRNNDESEESSKVQLSKERDRAKEGVGSHLEVDESDLESEIKRLRYQDIRSPSACEDYNKLVNEKCPPKERSMSREPHHSKKVRSMKAAVHEEGLYGRSSLLRNNVSPQHNRSSPTVEMLHLDSNTYESYDRPGSHRYGSEHKSSRNNRRNHSAWEEGSRFNDREPPYGEKAPSFDKHCSSFDKHCSQDFARKDFRDELNREFDHCLYQSKSRASRKEYYDDVELLRCKVTEEDLISVSPNRGPNFRHEDSDGASDERSRRYTKGDPQLNDREDLYPYDRRQGARNEAQPRYDETETMYGERKSPFDARELRYGKAEAQHQERLRGVRMEDLRFTKKRPQYQGTDDPYEEGNRRSNYVESGYDNADIVHEERGHRFEYRESQFEEDRLEYVDIRSPLGNHPEYSNRRSKYDLRYSKYGERDPRIAENRTASSHDYRAEHRSTRFDESDHHYDQGKYIPLELDDNREELATMGTDVSPSYYERDFEHYVKRRGNECESEYYEQTGRRGCTSSQINEEARDVENRPSYSGRLSSHTKDPRVAHSVTSAMVLDREPVSGHGKAFYDSYDSESNERGQCESSRFHELDHDLRHNRPSQEKGCVYRDDRENRMSMRDEALSSDRDDLRCYLKNLRHMRDDLRHHLDDDGNDEVILNERSRPQEVMRPCIDSDKQRQFSVSPNVLERMAKRDRDIDMELKGSLAERRRLENIRLKHGGRQNYPRRCSPQVSGSDISGEELRVEAVFASGSRVGKQLPSVMNQTEKSSKKNVPMNRRERSNLPSLMSERYAERSSSFADQELDFMSDAPPKGLKSHREDLDGSYDQQSDSFRYVEASKPLDFGYSGRKVTSYERGYDSYTEDIDSDGRPFFGGILRDEERANRPSARQLVRRKPKNETRSKWGQEEWP